MNPKMQNLVSAAAVLTIVVLNALLH